MQLGYIGTNIYRTLTVLAVAVVLLLTVTSAWGKGKRLAEAEAVLANSEALVKGMEYFYNDQDRYPAASEFGSDFMSRYYSAFPPRAFSSGPCEESFSYKRNSATEYLLGFCLPISAGGFEAGWNTFVQNR